MHETERADVAHDRRQERGMGEGLRPTLALFFVLFFFGGSEAGGRPQRFAVIEHR
jgi:hypothetical protein